MTEGLHEIEIEGITSKRTHYYKAFYEYPKTISSEYDRTIRRGQLLIEINSFANPYTYEKRSLSSFLTDPLQMSGNTQMIEEYEMTPFEVDVLDKRRTLTEKLISLIRCSLADDFMPQLIAKIRHFYDLYYLMQDIDCLEYINNKSFVDDFSSLYNHDRKTFDKPERWREKTLTDSPLITNMTLAWSGLQETYLRELPYLSYRTIPEPSEVIDSFRALMNLVVTKCDCL